ncbi:MAG: flagellar protein FlgN [Eubacteriales bacterium]|nr:flagellar protein FlgN [Eubacteriales bacterium]
MASLIETLTDVMNRENAEYSKLLELAKNKTEAIVKGDVENLQEILGREQKLIDSIGRLDEERESNVKDICNVLNLPYGQIKVNQIVQMLEGKPKEHDALLEAHLGLKRTLELMMKVNENNKLLLKESMDMIEFELNLARSAVMAPQTATYGRGAYEQTDTAAAGSFDAKQ